MVNTLKTMCNIAPETTLLPNEAIVEMWATLFQCVFVSMMFPPLQNIIAVEQEWGLAQARRIIESTKKKAWVEESNSYC